MLFLATRVKNSGEKVERTQSGYSLTGKTAILHIVILGSSPNISRFYTFFFLALAFVFLDNKKLEKLNLVERNSEDV